MVTASSGRKVWWQCGSGHEWRTTINGRGYGSHGCPACAEYGFNPALDAWIYLLEHSDHQMQQIGISNKPKQRLQQHGQRGWVAIDIRGPMNGDLARSIEQSALKSLMRRGARLGRIEPAGIFSGYTEAWSTSDLRVTRLTELIKWVREDES